MAQKTKAEILSEITTLLADNNVGDISAEDVRSVFTDIKDSYPNLSDASVSETEFGYLDGVTSNLQTQIDGKQDVVAGVSSTEIGYLDGVTSAIQTQIDSKANLNGPDFTGKVTIESNVPNIVLKDANAVVDNKDLSLTLNDGDFRVQYLRDDGAGGGRYINMPRNDNSLVSFDLRNPSGVQISLETDGDATFEGLITANGLDVNGNDVTNIDQLTLSHSGSGTGASFTHNGTGNAVSITKSNSGDALDVVSGTVRIQALTADRWLFVDSNNRVTVKTNAELLTAIGAITEVSEDTTPQLGGNLDAQNNRLLNVGELSSNRNIITQQTITSTSGNASFNFAGGQFGSITLTEGVTMGIEAANGDVGHLLVTQDATGGRTLTLTDVQWAAGSAPTFTSAANGKDLVKITAIGGILVGEVIAQNIS